jgi:hypothetical protein
VVYILLLNKDVAPSVVTAETRWLFMITPWLGAVMQGAKLPRIMTHTVPKQ